MYQVYRGVNYNTREVYFGVSSDVEARKSGSHCQGGTKALRHWDCENHGIRWWNLSRHLTQAKASEVAHNHERTYKHPQGFKVIKTAGI